MIDKLELILIFVAVLTGVISATYFYLETGIFMRLLQKSLRLVALGMFIISIGVMLSAYISFMSSQGITVTFIGVPLSATFYLLYLLGSVMIAFGASGFTHHPKPLQ